MRPGLPADSIELCRYWLLFWANPSKVQLDFYFDQLEEWCRHHCTVTGPEIERDAWRRRR